MGSGGRSFATFKSHRAATTYVVAGLGEIYIEDLSFKNIKTWIDGLTLHTKTKKNYQAVLIRMMKDVLRNGDTAQLPEFVEWRAGRAIPIKKKEWIDKKMQERILAEIPAPDQYIFRFLFTTGVRVSEA